MTRIGIVDYGSGNIYNLQRGVRAAGAVASLVTAPEALLACDALLLPGVGAFGDGMRKLREAGLEAPVKQFAASGRPLLGICLGMQMLLSRSEELGVHEGFGLIPGEVVALPRGAGVAVPHVGWEPLAAGEAGHALLDGVEPAQEFYFTHSFVCRPQDERAVIARCAYGGQRFAAVVARDNVMGCQFHPEMSSAAGLRVLENFLRGSHAG